MNKKAKVFSIFGICSVGIFLIAAIISMISYESFSPLNTYVSALGYYTGGYLSVSAALIFNIGLVVAGLLACIFMLGYGIQKGTGQYAAVSFFGILSGVLIAAQGIYSLNFELYHYIATIAFFASIFIMCALYVIFEMLGASRQEASLASVIVAFFAGIANAVFAGFILSGGMPDIDNSTGIMPFAMIEWVSWLLILAFILILSIKMLRANISAQYKMKTTENNQTRNIEL